MLIYFRARTSRRHHCLVKKYFMSKSEPFGAEVTRHNLSAGALFAQYASRTPLPRQARLCCTCGRAAADAVRSRAREKRATNRATRLQLLHPRTRGAVCVAFLARKQPSDVADVRVQGRPAQPKRTKNSVYQIHRVFGIFPNATAGLEPVHEVHQGCAPATV